MSPDNIARGVLAAVAFGLAWRAWHLRHEVTHSVGRRTALMVQIIPLVTYGFFWVSAIDASNDWDRLKWLAWLSRIAFLSVVAVFWVQQQAIRDSERVEGRNGSSVSS